jgi:hypothetical protein
MGDQARCEKSKGGEFSLETHRTIIISDVKVRDER